MPPGNEVSWDFDPDKRVLLKYAGCENNSNPLFTGYGSSLCYYDPGTEQWYFRRVSDVSGYNRPRGGCGRSTLYDTKRKKWWMLGGVSGEPYPCQGPGSEKPWSYDFTTDLFTSHNVPTSPDYLRLDGTEGGLNLQYSPEFDIAVSPENDGTTWQFSFETHNWTLKTGTGGPGHLSEHAGHIVWVPTLHAFLCFNKGKTLAYHPATSRWTDLNPGNPPPSREIKMGFSYDSRNDIVLLVAGFKTWNVDPANDMWAYHPSANTWEELNPVPAPGGAKPSRGCQHIAYDSVHNVFYIGVESSNSMFVYRYKGNTTAMERRNVLKTEPLLSTVVNPVRSWALLKLSAPAASLKIHDIRGRVAADLTGHINAGTARWDVSNTAAGIYHAVLLSGGKRTCVKIAVMEP